MSQTDNSAPVSPTAIRLPSGEKASAAPDELIRNDSSGFRSVRLHSRTVLSAPDEARRLPLGSMAMHLISPLCPSSRASSLPEATSHSRSSPGSRLLRQSPVEETRIVPSGVNARL